MVSMLRQDVGQQTGSRFQLVFLNQRQGVKAVAVVVVLALDLE